ncbi:MAG TPA: hypothetical protein VFR78_08130 [Pyrinomonadaceae bacterium]|nr:hypothetical protein [Pyrinomonadaceae bacterium]
MRRYAVRVLVAVLTFGIGVAFSLFLGLFKFQEHRSAETFVYSKGCPKTRAVSRPAFVKVDSEYGDPLKLSYLGPTSDSGLKLLVENRRDQTILGFSVSGKRLWSRHGSEGETAFSWNFDGFSNSGRVLRPGETYTINLPPNTEGLSVLVDEVTFESGFTWINPRLR